MTAELYRVLSDNALGELGTIISHEIDQAAEDSISLDELNYAVIAGILNDEFDLIIKAIQQRGGQPSDFMPLPKFVRGGDHAR